MVIEIDNFYFWKYTVKIKRLKIRSGPSKKKHKFVHLSEFVARKTKRIKHHGYNNDNNIGELMRYMWVSILLMVSSWQYVF